MVGMVRSTSDTSSSPLLLTLPPSTSPLLLPLLNLFRSFGSHQLSVPSFDANYAVITYDSPLGREKALCQDGVVFKDSDSAYLITVRVADSSMCDSLGIVMGGGGGAGGSEVRLEVK